MKLSFYLHRNIRSVRFAVAAAFLAAAFSGPKGAWAQVAGASAGAASAPSATGTAPAAGQAPTAANPNGPNRSTTQTDATRRDSNDQTDHRADVPAGSQDLRTEFQQMVEATTGRRLPIFGESLFQGVPSTFAPIDNVPIGLRLHSWPRR